MTPRPEGVVVVDLARRWADLVGPQIAEVTRIEELDRHGVLWVAVQSPAWAAELQAMTPRLLARVQASMSRIQEIRWVGTAPQAVPGRAR